MHTVNQMIIPQLSAQCALVLPRLPVFAPLGSLKHLLLLTEVYGAPPLPSAGVCQTSSDESNSIGPTCLSPPTSSRRAGCESSPRRPPHTNTLHASVCCGTGGPRVIIFDPNLILQRTYGRPSRTGWCAGLNKQQRGAESAQRARTSAVGRR